MAFWGKTIVKDNYNASNPTNISIPAGKTFDISNLGEGSSIGITVADDSQPFTGTLSSEDQAKVKYLYSDKSGYYIDVVDGKAMMLSTNLDNWNTLRSAIASSSAPNTFTLSGDCIASSGSSKIVVSAGQNITINLNGHTLSRGFYGNGIVIDNSGTLIIKDTAGGGKITGGKTNRENPGAIRNSSTGKISIYGGDITENYIYTNEGAYKRYGAGINNKGTVNIYGGSITNNNQNPNIGDVSSYYYGGGIYNDGGTIYMSGGTISGNKASYGGGIYNYRGTVTITGGTISDNTGTWEGGGIYSDGGTLNIKKATFSGNRANNNGGGGAVFSSGTAEFTNCIFTENSALRGGAVTNYYSGYDYHGNMTITGSVFDGNSASQCGGALYNFTNTDATMVTVTDSEFTGNSCGTSGGAIDNDSPMTIMGSTFTGNHSDRKGGAIYNEDIISVSGIIVCDNSAPGGGAGIYLVKENPFTVEGEMTVLGNALSFETEDAVANNVQIESGALITVAADLSSSTVGVTCPDAATADMVFTKDYSDYTAEDPDKIFIPDQAFYTVSLSNGEARIHKFTVTRVTVANLSLAGDIQMNAYIKPGDDIDSSTAYYVVTGPNGNVEGKLSDCPLDETYGYKVAYNVYANQMDEDITIRMYESEGGEEHPLYAGDSTETCEDGYGFKVNTYLQYLYDHSETGTVERNIANSMMTYGRRAYRYFKNIEEYDNPDPIPEEYYATPSVLEPHKTLTSVADTGKHYYAPGHGAAVLPGIPSLIVTRSCDEFFGDPEFYGTSLNLMSKPALRFYFKKDIRNAYFNVDKTWEANETQYYSPVTYTTGKAHGMYYIEISDIPAYELDNRYVIRFYTNVHSSAYVPDPQYGVGVCWAIESGAFGYAYSVIAPNSFKETPLKAMLRSLYYYYTCAKAYQEAH